MSRYRSDGLNGLFGSSIFDGRPPVPRHARAQALLGPSPTHPLDTQTAARNRADLLNVLLLTGPRRVAEQAGPVLVEQPRYDTACLLTLLVGDRSRIVTRTTSWVRGAGASVGGSLVVMTMTGPRVIGMLGGMSWDSSAQCYRLANEGVRERLRGRHPARVVLASVDFADIEAMQVAGRWDEAGQLLAEAAQGLEAAGAELLLILHQHDPQGRRPGPSRSGDPAVVPG